MFILKQYDHFVDTFNTLEEIEMFIRKTLKEKGGICGWSSIEWNNIEIIEKEKGKYFFKYVSPYNKKKFYLLTAIDLKEYDNKKRKVNW